MPKGFDNQHATFDETHTHSDPWDENDRKEQNRLKKLRNDMIRRSRENPAPLPTVEDARARDAVILRMVEQRKKFEEWGYVEVPEESPGESRYVAKAEIATIDGALSMVDFWRPQEWLDHYNHIADLFDTVLGSTNRADRRAMKKKAGKMAKVDK